MAGDDITVTASGPANKLGLFVAMVLGGFLGFTVPQYVGFSRNADIKNARYVTYEMFNASNEAFAQTLNDKYLKRDNNIYLKKDDEFAHQRECVQWRSSITERIAIIEQNQKHCMGQIREHLLRQGK